MLVLELSPARDCWLTDYYDNVQSHFSLPINKYLAKKDSLVFPHPPYFPAFGPNDYLRVSKKNKRQLWVRDFKSVKNVRMFVTVQLKALTSSNVSINGNNISLLCVASQWKCFEEDKIVL